MFLNTLRRGFVASPSGNAATASKIAMGVAGGKPAARYDRLLLCPAPEIPQIHHRSIDRTDGKAHMALEVLRALRHAVLRPIAWRRGDEKPTRGNATLHQVFRLGPSEHQH